MKRFLRQQKLKELFLLLKIAISGIRCDSVRGASRRELALLQADRSLYEINSKHEAIAAIALGIAYPMILLNYNKES
jgi:hypothetical protein